MLLGTSYSDAKKFWNDGSKCSRDKNSPVTWTGAPDGYSVPASISVPADVPKGSYTIELSTANNGTQITNPTVNDGSAKLEDKDVTRLTFEVVDPPPPSDTSAPVITPNIQGTLGNNDWYTSDVLLSWTVVDNESTISSRSGCADVNITSDQNATTYTCTATSAGGTNSQDITIKRDATAPTAVTFVGGGPADGGSYDWGNVPAAPTCEADGAISGLASCTVDGYSSAVGNNHTLTATATDNAGNQTTATRTYAVKPATAKGFYQPIDMGGVTNTVKGGSTVPVKFELFGGASGTEQKNLSDVSSVSAKSITCGTAPASSDAIEEIAPTSASTGLRFDTTGDQFIYNWKTSKVSSDKCYLLQMTAADGQTTLSAYFKVRP